MTSMFRCFLCAALVALLADLPGLRAQSLGGSAATKENLDLPYDAIGDAEAEEDAPEIVTFYGTQHEGDGFFYVIDRSSSMRDTGEIEVAKKEVVKNITEFSERVFFGICFFDAGLIKFPASGQAAEANPAMKASGTNFVMSTVGGGGSCPQSGLSAALRMANSCPAKRAVVIYLGDGGGTCQGADEATYQKQTLAAISAQNYKRVQINTIGVLDVPPLNEQFLRNLATSNGGTFTKINK